MEVALLFSLVIGLLIIGVPIAVSLGMSSVLFLLAFSDSSLASIAQTLFSAFEGHYTLLAIPFFILASAFMTTGGVAKRIIRFSIACVGHLPGGLAIAGVFACMLFAALSGSSPATVVAIGTIVIGGMIQVGYSKEFAAGVICNAGTLGILIPPSIVMVVYAASVEVSVGRMFLAGVIPGLLAGLMLMTAIYVMAKIKNLPKGEWQGWREIVASGREAGWGLFLIVIILGGTYGGIFTPTEAAAVGAIGTIAMTVCYKTFTLSVMFDAMIKTLSVTAMILTIVVGGTMFASVFLSSGGFDAVRGILEFWDLGKWGTLILILTLVFFAGFVLDGLSIILIIVPIGFPIIQNFGFDPIWFAVLFLVVKQTSYLTPPMAGAIFYFRAIAPPQISLMHMYKGVVPFIILDLIVLVLVMIFPSLALWLPAKILG